MSSVLGNSFANSALLTYFHQANTWLGLHLTDPGALGDMSTEMFGGGYHRQPINWGPPSSKTIATTNYQKFEDLPSGTVNYLGVWNAASTGNILVRFQLGVPVPVSTGDIFTALPGDISFTL